MNLDMHTSGMLQFRDATTSPPRNDACRPVTTSFESTPKTNSLLRKLIVLQSLWC